MEVSIFLAIHLSISELLHATEGGSSAVSPISVGFLLSSVSNWICIRKCKQIWSPIFCWTLYKMPGSACSLNRTGKGVGAETNDTKRGRAWITYQWEDWGKSFGLGLLLLNQHIRCLQKSMNFRTSYSFLGLGRNHDSCVSCANTRHQCQISRSTWNLEVPLNNPYLLALCMWTKIPEIDFFPKLSCIIPFLGVWFLESGLTLRCPA